MTKLSKEQENLLELIRETKADLKNVRYQIRANLDQIIAEKEAPLRTQLNALVARAWGLGTPKRRIGLAMSTTSMSTVNEMLDIHKAEEAVEDTATALYNFLRADGAIRYTGSEGAVDFYEADGEWLVVGDDEFSLQMERTLFGAEPDKELRSAFDAAVSE